MQLPEPLILFRYYNDFIGLAKESQSIIVEEVEASRGSLASETRQVSVELNRVLFKIRDLLRQLPPIHYKTLQFLVEHLHRYIYTNAHSLYNAIYNTGIYILTPIPFIMLFIIQIYLYKCSFPL